MRLNFQLNYTFMLRTALKCTCVTRAVQLITYVVHIIQYKSFVLT